MKPQQKNKNKKKKSGNWGRNGLFYFDVVECPLKLACLLLTLTMFYLIWIGPVFKKDRKNGCVADKVFDSTLRKLKINQFQRQFSDSNCLNNTVLAIMN